MADIKCMWVGGQITASYIKWCYLSLTAITCCSFCFVFSERLIQRMMTKSKSFMCTDIHIHFSAIVKTLEVTSSHSKPPCILGQTSYHRPHASLIPETPPSICPHPAQEWAETQRVTRSLWVILDAFPQPACLLLCTRTRFKTHFPAEFILDINMV